jgi:hypothetical protein
MVAATLGYGLLTPAASVSAPVRGDLPVEASTVQDVGGAQTDAGGDDAFSVSGLAALLTLSTFLFVILVVPWVMARSPAARNSRPAPDAAAGAAPARWFSSDQERRLWLWTLAVIVAIYSTLSPAQKLAAALRERDLLGVSSGAVMLGVGMALAAYWARTRPGRLEIGAGLGVAAVYLTTLIRLPVPEARSHLFEYGLVAILIYHALGERRRNGRRVPVPALLAAVATALLGWIDEGIQATLPNRVYDLADVGINAVFGVMAITASLVMTWARSLDIFKLQAS